MSKREWDSLRPIAIRGPSTIVEHRLMEEKEKRRLLAESAYEAQQSELATYEGMPESRMSGLAGGSSETRHVSNVTRRE